MASSLSRQTRTITMIPIQSHIKRRKIPPKLMKKIEFQSKLCEKAYNHTIKLTDWKSEVKLKKNLIDDQYEIDEKSVNEAASYNALIVGSENYNQQYPQIAHQNIMNIFNTIHRRIQRKQWNIPQSICSELGLNILTPINFNDPLNSNTRKSKKNKKNKDKDNNKNKILPFILTKMNEAPQSLINIKDGSDKNNMPYFINNDLNIEVLIYRDIAANIKSRHRIQRVIKHFEPDSIITECNAYNFQQFHKARYESNSYLFRNTMPSMLQYVAPSFANINIKCGKYLETFNKKAIFNGNMFESNAVSSAVNTLISSPNMDNNTNVIAGNICDEYHNLLYEYAFLCDLFSISAIEISPILENKILPKKIKIKSGKLLKSNNKLTSEMRYLIGPYFFPHLHLFGQITNSYLIHCLYGCVNQLNSKKILIIVNDNNAFDLITKLKSNASTGYYFKYSYNSLFKEVNDEFVTMPSILPSTHTRDSSVKLQEFEWKQLHSMFGLKFVEFLEHEIEMKQALVAK